MIRTARILTLPNKIVNSVKCNWNIPLLLKFISTARSFDFSLDFFNTVYPLFSPQAPALSVCDKRRLQTCRPADLQTGFSQLILKTILCNLRRFPVTHLPLRTLKPWTGRAYFPTLLRMLELSVLHSCLPLNRLEKLWCHSDACLSCNDGFVVLKMKQ